MKTLLFVLFTTSAFAEVDCERHKIYCHIRELKPNMNSSYAMALSNKFYKYSKKHNGDPRLAVAIAMQETSIRNIDRQQSIIIFSENCDHLSCETIWKIKKGVSDVCMFQFHVNTILTYNIDPVRLKEDIDYCIEWHYKLMNKKKKYCKDFKKPWACYHSKTKIYREQYIKLVERYL